MTERTTSSEPEPQITEPEPGTTEPTVEADTGQGAGPTDVGSGQAPAPERRRGRVIMRGDTAQRLGRPHATEDEELLKPVPVGRPDFIDQDPWRALRILSEFVDGFDALAGIGPAVTIFEAARVRETNTFYEVAPTIARRLAESGFAIITGGGPGITEIGKAHG
jgi:hypothetical protein